MLGKYIFLNFPLMPNIDTFADDGTSETSRCVPQLFGLETIEDDEDTTPCSPPPCAEEEKGELPLFDVEIFATLDEQP